MKRLRLGIISDCIHYNTPNGKVGTENHILLRQLEALSSYFSSVLICCPFAPFNSTKVVSTYTNSDISFEPMPLVGGSSIKSKLNLLFAIPKWLKGYKRVDNFSDIVYQRFPNNINIPAFFYFRLKKKKVFATYTGTWNDYNAEPVTYKLQKKLLQKYFRGPVWVYTDRDKKNNKIQPGFSPSYSIGEWNEETEQVAERINKIQTVGIKVFRLITVGTLIDYKNQLTILKACVILKKRNFPFNLKIVGDGPMFNELKTFIEKTELQDCVELSGKKNYQQLRALYRNSDLVVQAPLSEGFGKVPVEGFFHGVVPVINDISLAKQLTANGERGFLFDGKSAESLVTTLEKIQKNVQLLPAMIGNGRSFGKTQTLEAWAKEYYETVMNYFEEA